LISSFPRIIFSSAKLDELILRILGANPLFLLKKEEREQVEPVDKPLVERLVRMIKRCFINLMAVLLSDKYPKTRAYLENFYNHVL